MNKIDTSREEDMGDELYRRIYLLIKKNGWARQSIGAAFGLAGGMLSIILGALLWVTTPLLAPGSFASFLNVLEIVFFVLPLPLLALGAYCLDLLEKKPPLLPLRVGFQPARSERLHRLRLQRPHNN